jgi:sRNA-binding protein
VWYIINVTYVSSLFFYSLSKEKQKSNKKSTTGTITKETKREGQGKAKTCTTRKNQKREKLVPFVEISFLTHGLSSVVDMQLWDLIVMGSL